MAQGQEKRVVGRYMLHGEIASGGMATVYFGRLMGEAGFSRVVAIKRLHPQFVKDADFRDMFLDEARVCARVRHPNVVSILDVVGLEGELFLVMEYVQGETLARLTRSARAMRQNIPIDMVASIMSGVLDGLHAAHEACNERGDPLGIVHRDVSPQNIIVGVDGVARVVDFGVAKAAGRLQTTRDGQLKGKLSYMAPEQLAGEIVDRRTDVYAASVVLWEALAGRRLFDGDHEAAVFGQVLQGQIDPPSQFSPDVSSALDAITLRGLSKDPEARFPTALEMAMAIENAVPLASARQVGQRVTLMAQAALQKRTEKFVEIESVTSISLLNAQTTVDPEAASAPRPSAPSLSGEQVSGSQLTNLSMAGRASQQPRSRAGLIAALTAAGLVGALLVIAVVALVPRKAAAPPENQSATPAHAAEPSPPAAVEPPAPAVSTAPTAAPAPEPVNAATAQPSRVRPTSKHTPAQPSETKTAAPKPSPAADCNPPYTLDSKGTRIPKLHCL